MTNIFDGLTVSLWNVKQECLEKITEINELKVRENSSGIFGVYVLINSIYSDLEIIILEFINSVEILT